MHYIGVEICHVKGFWVQICHVKGFSSGTVRGGTEENRLTEVHLEKQPLNW